MKTEPLPPKNLINGWGFFCSRYGDVSSTVGQFASQSVLVVHINDYWMTVVKFGSDHHLTFMVPRGWSIWFMTTNCKTDIPITLLFCGANIVWSFFFFFFCISSTLLQDDEHSSKHHCTGTALQSFSYVVVDSCFMWLLFFLSLAASLYITDISQIPLH